VAYLIMQKGQPSAKRLMNRVPKLETYKSHNSLTANDVVIRWGTVLESDPTDVRIFNTQSATLRTQTKTVLARTLRRLGVRFLEREIPKPGADPIRLIRHYRIPIFNMEPLSCFRSEGGQVWLNQRIQRIQEHFREVSIRDDKVTTRAVYLAMRSLHALGLDFGLVSIGMAPKGVLHVLDVTPTPFLEGRMLDLFSGALQKLVQHEERYGTVMLGTDIELMLRNQQGKMVLASDYMGRKGRVGCDDRSVQFDGKRLPLMELRPLPQTTPLMLVEQLRDTMLEASKSINRVKVEWRGGSMPFRPYCTGGHIHFSNVALSSRLVRVLDNYLGLPLMMVENPRTAALRRPRYGFLGDIRHKDYGGFEYRTPASFVVSQEVTFAAFCIAYIIAHHESELPTPDLYEPNVQAAFYRHDIAALRPIVERNFQALRQTSTYDSYRDYIEPLWNMITIGATWNEDVDVRVAWNVPLSQAITRPRRNVASR